MRTTTTRRLREMDFLARFRWSVCSAALLAVPLWVQTSQAALFDTVSAEGGDIKVYPLQHATLALQWGEKSVVVDPVGGAQLFQGLPRPDLILVTDIHQDHFNVETLNALVSDKTKLVVSAAVADQLPASLKERALVGTPGKPLEAAGIRIDTIPAYNQTADRLKYHPKGRGNGYLLVLGGKRVYVSGDTEDIPEMLALKNIDVAFLCMNLPYTMTVEQAARAVRAFKPKIVYPYHYRGSDLEQFKKLVGSDSGVEVRVRDWYGTTRK